MSAILTYCFPRAGPGGVDLPLHGDHQAQLDARRGSRAPGSQSRAFTWKRLITSYWTDWVFISGLWIIYLSISRIPGHRREFSLKELSIQHSFAKHERVPTNMLMFISAGFPLLVMLPVAFGVARNAWDVHNAVCGLFMSFTMTGVVTQVIKLMDHPVFGLSTWKICTQENFFILNDGFKVSYLMFVELTCQSFPSGHSSLSFAGVGFLALYLAGKMHLWDVYGNRNRAWFALSPLLIGAMVAISRTQDNRPVIAYRTYYPDLAHPTCHLPMLPRTFFGELEEEDGTDLGTGVGLLSDQQGIPRQSEEEDVWRRG